MIVFYLRFFAEGYTFVLLVVVKRRTFVGFYCVVGSYLVSYSSLLFVSSKRRKDRPVVSQCFKFCVMMKDLKESSSLSVLFGTNPGARCRRFVPYPYHAAELQ